MNLNLRQLATLVAALDYWKREGLMSNGYEHETARLSGLIEPLAQAEIDDLRWQLREAIVEKGTTSTQTKES